jgi:hypothetical protein
MRHLIEAVAQGLRADFDGPEQDIVLGIARHVFILYCAL